MLPIVSAPSAIAIPQRFRKVEAVLGIVAEGEALTGEWQGATSGGESKSYQTFDGELFIDEQAVGDYLAAAGERMAVAPGQIISVHA